jgi:hypothetical protein
MLHSIYCADFVSRIGYLNKAWNERVGVIIVIESRILLQRREGLSIITIIYLFL